MSRITLWDRDFNFIAKEEVSAPLLGRDITVTITGEGPIYDYLAHQHAHDTEINMTIDISDDAYQGGSRRRAARITKYEIEKHRCECGRSIITTTTIQGHRFA